MPVLNHFTLLPIRRREREGEHILARAIGKKKKRKNGRRNERKKREKRQRTGVGGACASTHRRILSHGVASRRQASSVARRAPLHSHVTLHRAARAYAVRVVARSRLDHSPIFFSLLLQSVANYLKISGKFRDRNAQKNFIILRLRNGC